MNGLVLEGGAHRGVYTAGVLDAFLDNGISFDGIIGVSAGAIHGASFVSKQKGRSVNYTAEYCGSPKYMGFWSLFTTGNYFNEKFCYYDLPEKLYPIDSETFKNNPADFYVVCTDYESGNAYYHLCPELCTGDINMRYLQASASMPVVARPLKIDGHLYADGGIADSIPIKKFQEMGYTKNIVVLTQEEKPSDSEFNAFVPLSKIFCSKYKNVIAKLETQFGRYSDDLEYLKQQEKEGKLLIIRPSVKPFAGVMERNPDRIRKTHKLGYDDAVNMMDKIKEFLNS